MRLLHNYIRTIYYKLWVAILKKLKSTDAQHVIVKMLN